METWLKIDGYDLHLTCSACPEQYDVYKDGTKVAYFRLRHGYFYASVPDVGGTVVFECEPEGDGIFYDDEREECLRQAIKAVAAPQGE